MGPTLIFDKSALQALSMDESVWLDTFLLANVVPLFYVETLADLDKHVAEGRSAEDLVGMLAHKTPSSAFANVHHRELLAAELAGYDLQLGKPVIAQAQTMRAPDHTVGVHIDEAPETAALKRWQQHDFLAVERQAARQWRAELAAHDSETLVNALTGLLPRDRKISSLQELGVDPVLRTPRGLRR